MEIKNASFDNLIAGVPVDVVVGPTISRHAKTGYGVATGFDADGILVTLEGDAPTEGTKITITDYNVDLELGFINLYATHWE